MTVWSHTYSILSRRRIIQKICLILLSVVFTTALFLGNFVSAAPNVTRTVNFQGRLLNKSGAVVADGHYNMEFKIYQGGTATGGGTNVWTEQYLNNGGTNAVQVRNGMFSVNLGTNSPFGTQVDWNSASLWLSMNIAGSNQLCDNFGTAPCAADGEMVPMKQITATPYALNAGALGGKEADDFLQIGQSQQTDVNNDIASIYLNKEGTGNLVHLQADGVNTFILNKAGNIYLGGGADKSISVDPSWSGPGKSLTISAGTASSGFNEAGGDLVLQGGGGDGTGSSGDTIVKANGSNSDGTFQVQNAAGDAVLNVNTVNGSVSTGSISLTSGQFADTPGGTGDEESLWDNLSTETSSYDDSTPINLGVTFRSNTAGYITGIKYYNPAGNNTAGTDIGKLWACNQTNCSLASSGSELASVTFDSDPTPGWKTATFSTPVLISPHINYIATYYTTAGMYHSTPHYFQGYNHANKSLLAPRDESPNERNGVFVEGSANFPTSSFEQSNYWVDVTFQPLRDVDVISSGIDMIINSSGKMTVGPTTKELSLQGSSVSISGDTSVKSGSGGDTSNTFQVQNTAGDSLINVSSIDSQVAIGQSDAEATLLVLDTKTTSGDPTGTSGAMYYNAQAGKFRCFENGSWADCITPLPIAKTITDQPSETSNSSDTTPSDVSSLGFNLTPNTKYYYKFMLVHESDEETTGVGFGITAPSSPIMSNWCVNTTANQGSTSSGHWGSYCGVGDASSTTSGSVGMGTSFNSTMEGYIETGTAGGDLQLRVLSEINNKTVTIKEGSFGILQIVQ